MAGRGVPQPVDGIDGDVHGRVEAYGHVRAVDVVVDRSGQADDADALFLLEEARALQGAVAADDDERVHFVFPQARGRGGTAFGRQKGVAAGGAEHGAAPLDDVGDGAGPDFGDVAVDEPLVAAVDDRGLYSFIVCGPDDSPYGGVHARRSEEHTSELQSRGHLV